MASIDYFAYPTIPGTKKRIQYAEDAEQVAKRLYRPVTRHLGDRLAVIIDDDLATTLSIHATTAGQEVQLLHRSQVEAQSEGETNEWQIAFGDFDNEADDAVTYEYLPAETEYADVAARMLAILDGIDNPVVSKPKRRVVKKAAAEPVEEVKVAPRRKLPVRKAQPETAPAAVTTAKKPSIRKLPVKKGAK